MKAIRAHASGGPEVLHYEDVPQPAPGVGQALIKVEAAGVNFIDVYQRKGAYPIPLPFIPGQEAATASRTRAPRGRTRSTRSCPQSASFLFPMA